MKAIVYKSPDVFDYEDVITPDCPEDGVLIRVEAVGLCGSDIRNLEFGHPSLKPPHIIGHEVAGIIDKVGGKVFDFEVGDRVVVNPVITCGKCAYCNMGLKNHCRDLTFLGIDIQGGYAQYVAMPHKAVANHCIHKIPEKLSFDYAPIAETAASVINAQNYINIKEGESVLIIGAGPIGCLHSIVAKVRGAGKVIVSEINRSRLEILKRFKTADILVDSSTENLKDIILKETNGLGVNTVIVACPVGAAQEQAFELVRCRGKILFFGGLPKDKCVIHVNSNNVHYDEIAVFGAYAYTPERFTEALELIVRNKIPAADLVTDIIPLKNIREGIDIVKKGQGIKVILKPWMD